MSEALLVFNAGSSSVKFSLFALEGAAPRLELKGQIEGLPDAAHFEAPGTERHWREALTHEQATDFLLEWIERRMGGRRLAAVGHRVVHGGTRYSAPVRVDNQVLAQLEALVPLAPLHQPHNLAAIRRLAALRPRLVQVACFDTAFHRGQSEVAQAYALPAEITREGVHRYGFHGLSYEYIAQALPQHDARAARGRTVVAHLGNGASMCALRAGASVASSMGFSALEGLPMGTRCGSLDPGVLLWLMDQKRMGPRAIEDLLYHRSGLLGVSGLSGDMRALLASDAAGARAAVDQFVYRIGRELGSLAAALGGLDALVFTAGIGEHAAPVRARVCRDAAWLGLELDEAANAAGGPRISSAASGVSAWVIATDEELMIARHTARLAPHAA
ncbi:MAG TPA: acetate/propionate family kinase [Burkholderiales bacterium]|nr:acetate/propionate family kinase [Burkholderiales bacterium]